MKVREYRHVRLFTVVLMLLSFAIKSMQRDILNNKLLHACASDSRLLAKGALLFGANVNYKDSLGRTPLNLAVKRKAHELVEILISRGAHVNDVGEFGKTALHHAAQLGSYRLIELLMKAHADVTLKDTSGWTALDYAKFGCHYWLVDLLTHAEEKMIEKKKVVSFLLDRPRAKATKVKDANTYLQLNRCHFPRTMQEYDTIISDEMPLKGFDGDCLQDACPKRCTKIS